MPLTVHVDELPGMVGRHLGHSPWHEITQRQVDLFGEATWDRQWIHTDPERAASGPYGGTIAHGFMTIALTPALLAEIWQVDGIDMVVNQNLTNLRFRSPIPVGARVRMGADLTAARRRPRGFTEVTTRLTFECSATAAGSGGKAGGGPRLAADADLVFLLHAAPPDQEADADLFAQLQAGQDGVA